MTSPIALGGTRPLTIGNSLALLFRDASVIVPTVPGGGPIPTTGIVGRWDASSLAWSQDVYSVADTSGGSRTLGSNARLRSVPRLAGALGGLHTDTYPGYSSLHPLITDYSLSASSIPVGAGSALTAFLVWSRPNLKQSNATSVVSLISIGGTTVLGMTTRGDGTDALVLFPATAATSAGTLKLRHTHSARLVFSSTTVDVWLDGTQVITGAPLGSFSLGATAAVAFLTSAQCIFHEAAAWSHAFNSTEHTALTSYAQRWPLGPRRAANGIIVGQSNAANIFSPFGSWPILERHIAYLTGAISSTTLAGNNGGSLAGGNTIWSGQGLYQAGQSWFLDPSSGAANVDSWPLGNNGASFMAALDGMTADEKENLRYIAWYWSESDSSMITYSDKNTYTRAMRRAFSLIRAHLGMTAAQLPILVINGLPFATDVGRQTHREAMQDIVNDASQNCQFMLAQTDDAIGQNSGYDAATGLETIGNGSHRDGPDVANFLRRASIPIARAVVAANAANSTPDAVTSIDASLPQIGGPKISAAHYEGGTSVLVTVTPDGGSDLIVPLRAAQGVGWVLMDGVSSSAAGTPGLPGTLIKATACARVSATQLRLTLASAPAYPGKAQLYYDYGSGMDSGSLAVIGRGNAVTDNFSTVTLAAGWQIGTDLGTSEQPNNPLQATTYGIALS